MPQASLMYRDLGRQLPQSRSPTSLSGCGESPGIFSSLCFRILFFLRRPGLLSLTRSAAPGHDSDNALLIRCIEKVGRPFHTHQTTRQLSIFAQTKLKARPRIRAGPSGHSVVAGSPSPEKKERVCGMGACSILPLLPPCLREHPVDSLGWRVRDMQQP